MSHSKPTHGLAPTLLIAQVASFRSRVQLLWNSIAAKRAFMTRQIKSTQEVACTVNSDESLLNGLPQATKSVELCKNVPSNGFRFTQEEWLDEINED
jgi:hypothetical protein